MPAARSPANIALASFIGVALASASFVSPQTGAQLPKVIKVQLPRVEIAGQLDKDAAYFDELRSRLHWVPVKVGREVLMAPDFESRLLLAKSAAQRARLEEFGLSHRDVYAIINAESSWVPRTGASRDGTPNLGIAQFEPETAKALGLQDPNDPVEAVHVAAAHIREAAIWSQEKLRALKLKKSARAEKLREGISVYYNLSTRGRNQWNGMNTDALPIETQRHIANARYGLQEAAFLEAQLKVQEFGRGRSVLTAKASDGRS